MAFATNLLKSRAGKIGLALFLANELRGLIVVALLLPVLRAQGVV